MITAERDVATQGRARLLDRIEQLRQERNAAILSPEKAVLLPALEAGCSLAATINADQLRVWRSQHPGAVVVSYVNTTAEVKALSDYCCTSSNAEAVIRSIP